MAFNRILDFSNGLDFYLGFFFPKSPQARYRVNAIASQPAPWQRRRSTKQKSPPQLVNTVSF